MRSVVAVLCIAFVFTATTHAETTGATYFDPPYTPSTCFGNQDLGAMVARVGTALWNNRAACRDSYLVKCSGGQRPADRPCKYGATVVVKIVGVCTQRCNASTIVLSRAAFAKIADIYVGIIFVDYSKV